MFNVLLGAILIFLPGYDEIVTLRDKLKQDGVFSKRGKYQILMLHSMLPPGNQRKVFGRPPSGTPYRGFLKEKHLRCYKFCLLKTASLYD